MRSRNYVLTLIVTHSKQNTSVQKSVLEVRKKIYLVLRQRLLFIKLCSECKIEASKVFNILGNSSEAGIWFHTPNVGEDLIIRHNMANGSEQLICKVEIPFLHYYLHISVPEIDIFSDVLRY